MFAFAKRQNVILTFEREMLVAFFRAVVLLNVYVISGVLYNAVRNKASGAGLFTHVLVCKALPGLVKVM